MGPFSGDASNFESSSSLTHVELQGHFKRNLTEIAAEVGVERMSNAFFGLGLWGAETNVKSHPGLRHIHHISGACATVCLQQGGIRRYLLTGSAISGLDQIP